MKQSVIAIDFDDVIFDFNRGFNTFHNSTYGTTVQYDELVHHDLHPFYGTDDETLHDRINEWCSSPHHADCSAIEEAVPALEKLKDQYRLEIITARPPLLSDHTNTWIRRHLPQTFEAVHFTNSFGRQGGAGKMSKAEVCRKIGAAVLIDDVLVHAEDVSENLGIPVLLPDRPWNRSHTPSGTVRVHSWRDILKWIEHNL